MQLTPKDVSEARLVYWLLLFSPLLSLVPCLGFLAPLVVLILVVIWAFSEKPFLAAHARQGLVLCLLGLFLVMLFYLSSSRNSANLAGLVMLGCGTFAVWVGGSIGGLLQAGQGNSWIGDFHAKIAAEPAPVPSLVTAPPLPAITPTAQEQVAHYLELFRTGEFPFRGYALLMLEELGEVEVF